MNFPKMNASFKENVNLSAWRRRSEFTIPRRTVHFNYNLYRTSSFLDLLMRNSVTMSTYARDTRLKPRIMAEHHGRNCHYVAFHAREFDFSERVA